MTWSGNASEEVRKVYEEISVLKSVKDCPFGDESIFWFKNDDKWIQEFVSFKLSKALFPFHTCCKVINPQNNTQNNPINGLQISFSVKNKPFESLKVFMADQLTSSFYDLHKRYVLDDDLVSSSNGIMNYKVKVLEIENLQGDPENLCINYMSKDVYGKCLETEILKQNSKFLNCSPPWMTDKEDHWCKGNYQFESYESYSNYLAFLNEIGISDMDPGKCLVPCKTRRFQSEEIGIKMGDNQGLNIDFEKVVEITKSEYQIGTQTLISRIGGFIVISKNFLWLIILSISTFGLLMSKLNISADD